MIIFAILMLLWLLPTFVFVGAAMMAIPGGIVRRGAHRATGGPAHAVPPGAIGGAHDLGR